MASSVTWVSPLAWISSTAIWGAGQGQAWGRDSTGGMGGVSWEGPRDHGVSTSSAHIPKEKMSTAVPSATSERGEQVRAGKADAGGEGGPPRLTSVFWREEVQVPRFLPLSTDGASKIVWERYGESAG